MKADSLWHRLSGIETISTGQRRFPMLCKLMKAMLMLPNSNCDAERVFSILRHIKTEFRSSVDHETLTSLMAAKLNGLLNINCYQIETKTELLKLAKSAANVKNAASAAAGSAESESSASVGVTSGGQLPSH